MISQYDTEYFNEISLKIKEDFMTILQSIGEPIQQFAEVTKAALKLDIDIFDVELNRVAGTGIVKNKIGDKIQKNGIVNRYIYSGLEKIIINNPGIEKNCIECDYYGKCIYKKAVYAAIKDDDEILGAMGILAFNDEQAANLDKNKHEMLEFVDKIAELIGNKVKDYRTTSLLRNEISGGINLIQLHDICGEDPSFVEFKNKIKRVARSNSTILLVGETGTGKEVFSRAIHSISLRNGKPFITINCGAIPENLIESELFGYEKGSFTGASKYGKHGKFQHADGGTIFLDEVENMPIYMQKKLLRVLENREIERIGSSVTIPVDIRIIVASNQNLEEMVSSGGFREDLFHRINVITLKVPALRNRGNDVLILADYFIEHYNKILNRRIKGISDTVAEFFMNYHWPGNVRELQNVIEYAMNMETTSMITYENLPERLKEDQLQSITLADVERQYIKKSLDYFGWSDKGKIRAAKALGISRSSIYRKIKKYRLNK